MRRLPAVPVFLAIEGFASFASMLTFTVTNLYYVTELGMTPLLLVLCGTAMELGIVLCEIPTGVVADTLGRRASVVLSFAIMGAATALFGVFEAPWAIVLAYGLWGIGYTFQSGALEAWIVDEVGDERMPRVLLRGGQVGWAAALAGVVASTAVGSVDLRTAIVAGGIGFLALSAFLALAMPETGFRPVRSASRPALADAIRTARVGLGLVRSSPILLLMLGIALCFGLWTESIDRLWQAHFLASVEIPDVLGLGEVGWIGLLTGLAFGLGVLTNELGVRRLERLPQEATARVLLRLHAVLLVAAVGFALAGSFVLAIVAYVGVAGARSLAVPLGRIWTNREISDPGTRATVLSIVNQADAFGQVAGGPAIGAIGTGISLRAALAIGAAALAPALVLYGKAARRHAVPTQAA
ncbi:MAG: MFS transporter [Actinobacteria bacterium]|nr:MFS transporter [Actinomycetota bacterium]